MKVKRQFIMQLEEKENIKYLTSKWLQNQDAYSLNKSVKRNFQQGCVIVSGIDDQWDADLASFARDADENDGCKYLLIVIDIFSHYAWIEPIKDKTAREIVRAFNKIKIAP